MQFKQTLVRLALILFPLPLFSQTTFIPAGDKAYTLLERLEILNRTDTVFNFSKTKPLSRLQMVNNVTRLYGATGTGNSTLSKVDRHNLTVF